MIGGAIFASMPFVDVLIARGDPYRVAFWKAYLNHVEAHPWIGSGLSAQIIAKAPDGIETTHPHNIVYHALLRGGVFAAAALVTFLDRDLPAGGSRLADHRRGDLSGADRHGVAAVAA